MTAACGAGTAGTSVTTTHVGDDHRSAKCGCSARISFSSGCASVSRMGVSTLAGRAGADLRIGALLPAGWWARGLALHERVEHPRPSTLGATDGTARARLRPW